GAGRWRIVRQSLIENLAISAAGGAAGILLARVTLGLLVRMAPPQLPHVGEIAVNSRALGVGIAAALACGFVIGLVPLWEIRRSVTAGLRASDRTVKGG